MRNDMKPEQSDGEVSQMVLVEDDMLVACLRGGRVLNAINDPLSQPTLIEIPRISLSGDSAARLAEITYLEAIRDTAATVATFFLRDLVANSAREYAVKSLEILLAAEMVSEDSVACCLADLDKWYCLAFGRTSAAVLRYLENEEECPIIRYRDALSMLILALRFTR